MQEQFAGSVAVVTGGATGIGEAVARRLAAADAFVIIAGRDDRRGDDVARAISTKRANVTFVRADVRRESDVAYLMDRAAMIHGRIDFVFNNAGIEGPAAGIRVVTAQAVDDILSTNVHGVVWGMKHAARIMTSNGGGVIVNNASFVGTLAAVPHAPIYGASKAAVISLTRAAAVDCAALGIRVHAVCPWMTDTPMLQRLSQHDPAVTARFASMNPSRRLAAPDDIAGVVLDLFAGRLETNGDALLVDAGGAVQRLLPNAAGAPAAIH